MSSTTDHDDTVPPADGTGYTNSGIVIPDGSAATVPKCSIRGCKDTEKELLQCHSCDRYIHTDCFNDMILVKLKLPPLPEDRVACTKKCHGKAKGLPPILYWHNDGKDGPEDPHTSERILIDWMTTPGNYSRYRGKNNAGKTKLQIAQELIDLFVLHGVRAKRNAKQVLSKITMLEDKFKTVHDWTQATGAGMEGTGGYEDYIKSRCPFYYDLLPIMQDRASAKPKYTSEDLLAEDSEEERDIARIVAGYHVPDVVHVMDGNEEDDDDDDDDNGLGVIVPPPFATPNAPNPPAAAAARRPILQSVSSKKTSLSISKKKKSEISLLTTDTTESIVQLNVKKAATEDLKLKMKELEYKRAKLDQLTNVRTTYSTLTREQVLGLFPELKEVADIVWKEDE
jgi:hypothetical protein